MHTTLISTLITSTFTLQRSELRIKILSYANSTFIFILYVSQFFIQICSYWLWSLIKICKFIKLSCVLIYRIVFTYEHLNNCLKDFSILFVHNYIVFSNRINYIKWKIASLTSAFYARSRLNLM